MGLNSVLRGSVVDALNLRDLLFSKARLEKIKLSKLYQRHNRHPSGNHETFSGICEHLADEMVELDEAIKKGDTLNIREELADISNCVDILAMVLDE